MYANMWTAMKFLKRKVRFPNRRGTAPEIGEYVHEAKAIVNPREEL